MPAKQIPTPTDHEIREAAYLMWKEEGEPHGNDQDYWYKAETALKNRKPVRKTTAKKPAAKKATTARKPAAKAAAPKAETKAAAPKAAAKKPAAKKTTTRKAAPKAN